MIRSADPSCEHQIAYWSAVYRFEHAGRRWALTFAGPAWVRTSAATTDLPQRWGIITAYNPGSRRLDAVDNERRARQLVAALDQLGQSNEASISSAPDGSWPEPGRVVWGVERGVIVNLARQYEQHAVIWASGGRVGLLEVASERWMVRHAVLK